VFRRHGDAAPWLQRLLRASRDGNVVTLLLPMGNRHAVMPATKDFRRRLLRASLLLDLSRDYKMRDEPEQKRNQTNRGVQSHRDQRLGDSKQPHKALSRESLAPVGSEISGRNAWL